MTKVSTLSALEICAGAGGQALGLEKAGFGHAAAVELDAEACRTLRANRPIWEVVERDVRELDAASYRGVALFAGGVPCPPFSIAGKQLGSQDDRDLFPAALRLIEESGPRAVMLENVPGLATAKFADYRHRLAESLNALGYTVYWNILNACDFGVPQLRPRFVLVALRGRAARRFVWPRPIGLPREVGAALLPLMASRQWAGAEAWAARARRVGPTLVGGSKLHGGPDLGPTRSRKAWAELGVDGRGLADLPPPLEFPFDAMPRLTVKMAAKLQGFPDDWFFSGKKTASYRQVGNAFPPPVATAVGDSIFRAIHGLSPMGSDPERTLPL